MVICTVPLSVFVILITIIIVCIFWNMQYFKRLGIKGPTPWPILGNLPAMVSEGFLRFTDNLYREYEGEKVYGTFQLWKPFLVIKNLDMIRDMCIKNFNNFPNRRVLFNEEPFQNIMTNIRDEHWRRVRHAVSPTFSVGKIRKMYDHIEDTVRILVANLRQSCKDGKEQELYEISSYFSMDVIAGAGFGVKLDSLNGKDSQFVAEANTIMTWLRSERATTLLTLTWPGLLKMLRRIGVEVLPYKSGLFFHKFVDDVIDNRRKDMISCKRHDLLQLMIDAEACPETAREDIQGDITPNDNSKKLTRSDIRGQALVSLLAGYDTVSTAMSFTLFLLTQHPEHCKKVQDELDRVLNGQFPTYDSVQELTYLEQCFNEALRMYPPGFVLNRECKEDINLQGIHIPKGLLVLIPVMSIHNDPEIWPDPTKFDPNRFSSENKERRHAFAHLPFGQGPRNCIGMKLAALEIKVAIAAVLQEMTPVSCEKSVYPVVLEKNELRAIDGLWVKFVLRS